MLQEAFWIDRLLNEMKDGKGECAHEAHSQ